MANLRLYTVIMTTNNEHRLFIMSNTYILKKSTSLKKAHLTREKEKFSCMGFNEWKYNNFSNPYL